MQVRFLGPVGLAKLAEHLCGGSSSYAIATEQAARVTPYFLRLAKHPLDTPDDFLGRLSKLAAGAVATVSHQESIVEPIPAPIPERVASPRDEPTLDRLHGMDDAVAWGNALRRDLDAYRAGELGWNEVDRGCLVSGPPGCGKTTFARALATTCGVSLYPGSYTTWLARGQGHQGDLMKGMRDTFAQAKRHAPSIVFIDELDSFPNRATVSHHNPEWEIQVVNGLLAEIDGVEQREGVILVGACNFPNKLDPALTRAGRLDRHILIGLPDSTALAKILREHLGEDAGDADLGRAALFLLGSTGADCEAIVRGARRRARNAARVVAAADLFEEILQADSRSPAELRLAAIHEAGHAAAAVACGFRLEGATIRGRGQSGGVVSTSLGGGVLTADDVESRLCLFLAGRAAEEVFLGKPSGGAGGGPDSDLARATLLAATAVSAWCLDGGFVWAGAPTSATLSRLLRDRPDVAALVRDTLAKAYDRAVELIRAHRPGIATLADVLHARGAVGGAEALDLLKREAGGSMARWPRSSAPRWLMPSPPKVPAARMRCDEKPEHV
jgi:ATP-dependent Zn protease